MTARMPVLAALALLLAASAGAAPAPWVLARRPPAAMLEALNGNARLVRSLSRVSLTLDCKEKNVAVGLDARLAYARPGQFRLQGSVLGQPALDVGAGPGRLWFHFYRGDRPVRVTSLATARRGERASPLWFHPAWFGWLLGLELYGEPSRYEISRRDGRVELTEKTTAPDGRRVRKVTVLHSAGGRLSAVGYRLAGETGKPLCTATVLRTQRDRTTGATLPRTLHVVWHPLGLDMRIDLAEPTVNEPLAARLFTPPVVW